MNRIGVIASVVAVILGTAALLTAGPLNPPAGPVAASYKTLGEVEPRTILSSTTTPADSTAVFVITQSGAYYLIGPLQGVSGRAGIRVAPGVTADIDLNGFTITGISGATQGILASTGARVTFRNGRVTGFPSHGVSAPMAGPSAFSDLIIENCGGNGFDLGDAARVENCIARGNTAIGFRVGAATTIKGCVASANGTGVELNGDSSAVGCTITSSVTRGALLASTSPVLTDCHISSPTGAGVVCTASRATIRGNNIIGNNVGGQIGLSITGTANVVAGNIVRQFADAYSISPGNQLSLVISQLPESLDWPCTATLAGPLSGSAGITINSDGVTLDLGGFELAGTGAGTGISSSGARRGAVVRNGSVRGWGAGGVSIGSCVSPQVVDIRASGNTGAGIATFGGEVLDCTSTANTGAGISAGDNAVVQRCTSSQNAGDNIVVGASSTVLDCTANGSSAGHGIHTTFIYNTVSRCVANSNALSGIRAEQRTRIADCTALGNTQHGVHITFVGSVERSYISNNSICGVLVDAGGGVLIRDNSITENGNSTTQGAGVRVAGAGGGNRIESNSFVLNYRSIDIQTGLNLIIKNTSLAPGAGNHVSIAGGNAYGPIVNVGGIGDFSGVANANHPQANLMY